jgi:hypothetical protein
MTDKYSKKEKRLDISSRVPEQINQQFRVISNSRIIKIRKK